MPALPHPGTQCCCWTPDSSRSSWDTARLTRDSDGAAPALQTPRPCSALQAPCSLPTLHPKAGSSHGVSAAPMVSRSPVLPAQGFPIRLYRQTSDSGESQTTMQGLNPPFPQHFPKPQPSCRNNVFHCTRGQVVGEPWPRESFGVIPSPQEGHRSHTRQNHQTQTSPYCPSRDQKLPFSSDT